MAVLEIRKYPDPILRKKAMPIERTGDEVRRFFDDMAETMYLGAGVGLAAPQVGAGSRLIVADVGEGLVKLANPKIMKIEGADVMEEGCLSVPDVCVKVKRAAKVVVEGLNEKGEKVTIDAQDLLAKVLQHEIDHLDGILIIDHLNPLKRALIKRKLRRQAPATRHGGSASGGNYICEAGTKKL